MAYPPEPSVPSRPAKDAIARSMSRYKGNRQAKTNGVAPPLPAHFSKLPPTSQREDLTPTNSQSYKRSSREVKANARSEKEPLRCNTDIKDLDPRRPSRQQAVAHNRKPSVEPLPDVVKDMPYSKQELEPQRGNVRPKTSVAGAKYSKPDRNLPPQRGGGIEPKTEADSGHKFTERNNTSARNLIALRKPVLPTLMSKSAPKKTFTERMNDHLGKYHSSKTDSRADLKRTISIPVAMGAGAEHSVPSFDAPISAVNAGERRVIVKFREYLISLPVTPLTTPLDIICATAVEKPELVATSAFIVLESFKQVGLERPLRKYEHVRDVLNSWDNDAQNTLVIVPSPTGGQDDDLNAKSVSKDQPTDTSVYMYYSQKPGHWDKRWITLRSDGQVVVKKGSEIINICHLSDFDIYVPTPRQTAKKIKPPKKICFAVKSQQKSSMFLSTANFVHFFSTNDKDLAASWYKVVQQRRSWYLVNTMGKGQGGALAKSSKGNSDVHGVKQKEMEPTIDKQKRSPSNSPSQQSPSNDWPNSPRSYTEKNGAYTTQSSSRNRSAPPISFPKKLTKDLTTGAATKNVKGPSFVQANVVRAEPEPFATNGLLGRTYSQRQRALVNREKDTGSMTCHSPTAATSHANGETGGLKRASSQRQKPKPLVDLTPHYQEPPQHSRKGRGLTLAQVPAGGLVDIATSPEIAIPIPPNKAWRRADVGSGEDSPTRPSTARRAV